MAAAAVALLTTRTQGTHVQVNCFFHFFWELSSNVCNSEKSIYCSSKHCNCLMATLQHFRLWRMFLGTVHVSCHYQLYNLEGKLFSQTLLHRLVLLKLFIKFFFQVLFNIRIEMSINEHLSSCLEEQCLIHCLVLRVYHDKAVFGERVGDASRFKPLRNAWTKMKNSCRTSADVEETSSEWA